MKRYVLDSCFRGNDPPEADAYRFSLPALQSRALRMGRAEGRSPFAGSLRVSLSSFS